MTRLELRQELRQRRGAITRAAEACGISKQQLSNFLAGRNGLSTHVLDALVLHLQRIGIEVSLRDLVRVSPRRKSVARRVARAEARP